MIAAIGLTAAACSGAAESDGDRTATITTSTATSTSTRAIPSEGQTGDSPASGPERPTATAGLLVLAPARALELAASGFQDAAGQCDTVDISIIERNAGGDIPALTTIVGDFLSARVDLIATITTPAAQAAHQVVGDAGGGTPVVYAVVTDPFSAGLAVSPSNHEPWITGSQSAPPLAEVIDAAEEMVPGLSMLGIVRSSTETNSQAIVEGLREIAQRRGLTLQVATVEDSSEVGQAAQDLAERGIDAFIVPTDTTVVLGLAGLVQVANDNDLLAIATDANLAADGAAIGLGTDYYGSGFRAGGIACRVLGGEATPADFDVVNIESLGVAINESSVAAQNVTVPEHLRDLADILG